MKFKSEKTAGFEDLLVHLRATNAMLARLLSAKAEFRQIDLILLLDKSGLPAPEIAQVIGTTANTVQVTLSRSRKRAPLAQQLSEKEHND